VKLALTGGSKLATEARAASRLIDEVCCFAAGTKVSTPAGLRPIEEIKVGDLVMSRGPKTGAVEAKPVTALIPGHGRPVEAESRHPTSSWPRSRPSTSLSARATPAGRDPHSLHFSHKHS
jgi:hypothetical protein